MSFFGTTDFFTMVALGKVDGATSVPLVFGTNTAVGTSFVDVSGFGDQTFPTAAESWEVVSSDANDTSAGTGQRTVIVQTYDDSLDLQTAQVISLAGTTPVALTGTHFRRRTFAGITAGSTGQNEGTITLRVASAGATRGQISIGNGSSSDSYYTVPNGKTAQVLRTAAFAGVGDDFIAESVVRNNGISNPSINIGGRIPIYQNSIIFPISTGILPEKFDFWFRAKTVSGTRTISTVAEVIEYDNTIFDVSAILTMA